MTRPRQELNAIRRDMNGLDTTPDGPCPRCGWDGRIIFRCRVRAEDGTETYRDHLTGQPSVVPSLCEGCRIRLDGQPLVVDSDCAPWSTESPNTTLDVPG